MALDFSNVENKLNAFLNPEFYETPKEIGPGLDKFPWILHFKEQERLLI